MDKTEVIETLEMIIVTWSLRATEPINDRWAKVTGEDPMSWKSNLVVRSEMLWFFLHMLNRFAFQIGGLELRAVLPDAIAQNAIEAVIVASFDASHVKKGFDVKEWQRNMAASALEELNEAEMDYSSCTTLIEKNSIGQEKSVLDKLSGRIGRLTGHASNPTFRILVITAAMDALAKSGLKEQVEKACSILR